MNYREALAWLFGIQRFGIKLGLENMHRLLRELGLEKHGARVLHVAGTNGKGSVCAMIDAVCRAQGYRTGLYTSPHLVTFRERIRVDGEMIDEKSVADGLAAIRELVDQWDPHPTFFEITTALALKHFSRAQIDLLVLETGMGGRLDATNALLSDVAVITPVDLDHQKWLGHTLEEIAREKAGIIKPSVPVVSAQQQPAVENLLRARAVECEAPLTFVKKPREQSRIGLAGRHQKENAALAIEAIRAAKIDVNEKAIAQGLESVEWPARFQRWDEQTVIDGAHNPAGARVLAETWREIFGSKRAVLIFAALEDKNVAAMLKALSPITEHVLLPRIRSERAADPLTIVSNLHELDLSFEICTDFSDALEKASKRSAPILITGSLHFAGEALAWLRGEPAAFEECAQ